VLKSYLIRDILNTQSVIIDVRSEGEFEEAHIPGSVSVPLLNNVDRAEVGTLYKNSGGEIARRRALEIVQPKLEKLFDGIALSAARNLDSPAIHIPKPRHWAEVFQLLSERVLGVSRTGSHLTDDVKPLIEQVQPVGGVPIIFCCWRGGDRSKSMALFARALGFNAGYIQGGHKAYRRAAQEFLAGPKYPFKLCTLYGLTGSGKTKIIQEWAEASKPVVDLEALASHRGSAFGQVGIKKRGNQKDFENNLFWQLSGLVARGEKVIVVEGESRRIGLCQLHENFLAAMVDGFHIQVVQPLDVRIENILQEYFEPSRLEILLPEIRSSLDAIKKRLGPERHKELSVLLTEKNYSLFTQRLLVEYYDKSYALSRAPQSFYHGTISSAGEWATLEKLFR
jgi:tRNA 2-selenouridine synthase